MDIENNRAKQHLELSKASVKFKPYPLNLGKGNICYIIWDNQTLKNLIIYSLDLDLLLYFNLMFLFGQQLVRFFIKSTVILLKRINRKTSLMRQNLPFFITKPLF